MFDFGNGAGSHNLFSVTDGHLLKQVEHKAWRVESIFGCSGFFNLNEWQHVVATVDD